MRGYVEEALSLAEKYRDFDILIEICEDLQDHDKLQHYMNLFNTEVRFGQIIVSNKYILFDCNFAETRREFTFAKLSIPKLASLSASANDNATNFKSSLRIESFAIVNLCGITLQACKELIDYLLFFKSIPNRS